MMIEKEGEYFRWNDILMTPEMMETLLGAKEEIRFERKWIETKDTVYTDLEAGEFLVRKFCTISNMSISTEENYKIFLGDSIIIPKDYLSRLALRPLSDFYGDFPKFNKKLHDEYWKEYHKSLGV